MVTTSVPLAMVPVTAWLLTGIEVLPEAAPAEVTVKACPPTVTVEFAGTATLNAATGMAVMVPVKAEVVAVRFGSSGGRSSLLMKPPNVVNPALKS